MKKIGIVLFILMFGSFSFAQSLAVVSHYPASAYVVDRLLPFVITGEIGLRVVQVNVIPAGFCPTLVDPYYENMFHIYCRKPGSIDLSIIVRDEDGEETTLELESLAVAIQRAPNDGFDTAFREAQNSGEE